MLSKKIRGIIKGIILGLLLCIVVPLFGGNKVQANAPNIILDYAHHDTMLDKGATYLEWNERDIVNSITEKVGTKLVNLGFTVTYTRELDESISINERVNLANSQDYWLYLSLHANSCESPNTGTGVEAFSNNEWTLSNNILNDLSSTFGLAKRNSPVASPFYNKRIADSTLLELGFINNDFDREILLECQDEIADIIVKNIVEDYNRKMSESGDKVVTQNMTMSDGKNVPVKVTYY